MAHPSYLYYLYMIIVGAWLAWFEKVTVIIERYNSVDLLVNKMERKGMKIYPIVDLHALGGWMHHCHCNTKCFIWLWIYFDLCIFIIIIYNLEVCTIDTQPYSPMTNMSNAGWRFYQQNFQNSFLLLFLLGNSSR